MSENPRGAKHEGWVTLHEAARLLGHNDEKYCPRLVKARRLMGEKVGGRWMLDPASLAADRLGVAAKMSSSSFDGRHADDALAKARARLA